MGTYYTTAVGAPPVCTELTFRNWLLALLNFRLNESPSARATTYFLAHATHAGGRAPSDSNDGLDGIGLNLSGATYTASTQKINCTLSGYTYTAGDIIYIKAATGIATGLYKIIASDGSTYLQLSPTADTRQRFGTLAAPLANGTAISSSTGPLLTVATGAMGKLANNVRFRFNRGDAWALEASYFNLANDTGITIDDYGDTSLCKPYWTQFNAAYSAGGWALTSNLTVTTPAGASDRDRNNRNRRDRRRDLRHRDQLVQRRRARKPRLSPVQSATLSSTGELAVTAAISLPSTAVGMNVYLTSGGSGVGRVGSVAAANTITLTALTISAPIPNTNATAALATYSRTDSGDVAWLREFKDVATPLYKTGLNNLRGQLISTISGSASASGGTIAAGTYYYVQTYVDANGVETTPTAATSITTTGSTGSINFTTAYWIAPFYLGAKQINYYVGASSSGPFYFAASSTSNPGTTSITSIPTTGALPPTNYPGWALTPVGAVEQNPGSWYIDRAGTYGAANTLYLHPRLGMPAPTNSYGGLYESVYSNTVMGVYNTSGGSSNDVRVENIRIDGFCVNSSSDVMSQYPIRSMQAGSGNFLCVGLEVYYASYHHIGQNNGNSGGIFTCVNCTTGRAVASGYSAFVSYAGTGGQEGLFYQCHSVGGLVRLDDRNNYPYATGTGGASGSVIFGHTGGGTSSLAIAWKCDNPNPDGWSDSTLAGFTAVPAWTDLANRRDFVVDCNFYCHEITPFERSLWVCAGERDDDRAGWDQL